METKEMLVSMLTENTGRHFLDSGGAYGRNWERNQGRDFEEEPQATWQFHGSEDGSWWLEATLSLYHWLKDRLEYDEDGDALFAGFAHWLDHRPEVKSRDFRGQVTWMAAAAWMAEEPSLFARYAFEVAHSLREVTDETGRWFIKLNEYGEPTGLYLDDIALEWVNENWTTLSDRKEGMEGVVIAATGFQTKVDYETPAYADVEALDTYMHTYAVRPLEQQLPPEDLVKHAFVYARQQFDEEIVDQHIREVAEEWHERAWGAYSDKTMTVNTYNGEDLLSQTIQYTLLEWDHTEYYLLAVHGGCDVRGGYTRVRLFESDREYALLHNAHADMGLNYDEFQKWAEEESAQLELGGDIPARDISDISDVSWYTDDGGYHWYNHGSGKDLNDYEASLDPEMRGKGVIYIDEDGKGYCPVTGLELQVYPSY